MIEIAFSSSVKRAFKKKIATDPNAEARFWERVEAFKDNPFDPRLRTHKLSGRLKDLGSFGIDHDLRVIFHFVDNQRAYFIDIGTHDEVY
jgi:mRNA-degrading endonuclease YafQ of YafQ-DinJ toxin-antitoxin module